jgi:hypothetical protein
MAATVSFVDLTDSIAKFCWSMLKICCWMFIPCCSYCFFCRRIISAFCFKRFFAGPVGVLVVVVVVGGGGWVGGWVGRECVWVGG